MIIFAVLVGSKAHAVCLAAKPNDSTQGKFQITEISSRPTVKCYLSTGPGADDSKDVSVTAPGCILKVKRISKVSGNENGRMEYNLYGGPGSCDFPKGKIIEAKISGWCCDDSHGSRVPECKTDPLRLARKGFDEMTYACSSKDVWYEIDKKP